jgi:Mg2+ and Co2+ transporter CorA
MMAKHVMTATPFLAMVATRFAERNQVPKSIAAMESSQKPRNAMMEIENRLMDARRRACPKREAAAMVASSYCLANSVKRPCSIPPCATPVSAVVCTRISVAMEHSTLANNVTTVREIPTRFRMHVGRHVPLRVAAML